MDYGFNLKYDTPDFISWAQAERERSDKRAQERMQNYINLMQMLGRGYGAYMYGKQARDKAAANKAWDTYMPAAQDLYNNELIGNVKSYDDTVNNLQMLGLNPYLTDIDKFRNLGADLEFDYTE